MDSYIGSPLTSNAVRVLMLGGGELAKGLVGAFQNLGLEVHVVDRYEGSPAQQVAHFSYTADIDNEQAVLDLVEHVKPQFVVPEVESVAAEALRVLHDDSAVTVVPTARACELTRDRKKLREVAERIGLPTTAYKVVENFADLEAAVDELGVPCIVKPDVMTSGRGHVLVKDKDQLKDAWNNVRRGTKNSWVVAEQFVDFDYEVIIMAVRSIDPETGKLATWFSEPIGYEHDRGNLVECWQPKRMSQRAFENARSVAARISNELGGRGIFAVGLFVAGDDIYFSSVTPRPSDKAMLTEATQRFSQYELHARSILGLPIDITLTSPGASSLIHANDEITEVTYTGVEDALQVAETDIRLFGKPSAYPGRRMGLVMATADNVSEARDRAAIAASKIVVGSAPVPAAADPAESEDGSEAEPQPDGQAGAQAEAKADAQANEQAEATPEPGSEPSAGTESGTKPASDEAKRSE
ncbi:Phosphoribosylglycinamide formyltransferase 2 [Corynebacterium casei]|nr:formate-dependent phosphoribosylglycinamide formyltransferase [Corynebacterium casei]SLM87510.1 Phosphoribosylglycinamide formyltransferase 2 [Corynebacterium casei]HCJ69786.1 formate-dependent phosphoribosylglycinamide formyltransferase [Corynebacterium casei]